MATLMANKGSCLVRLSWHLNVSNLRLRRHLDIPWLWCSDVVGLLGNVLRLSIILWLLDRGGVAWSSLRVIWLLDKLRFRSVHGLTVIGLVWRHILVWHVDVAVLI